MDEVVIALPKDLRERLDALAAKMGQSVSDCLLQAVTEFVDNWEDHLRVVAALQEGEEERPDLRAVIEG